MKKNSGKTEKPQFEVNGNEIKGWNHIERIFEEDSKQETEEKPEKIQVNRPLNKASNFTKQVFENTKHNSHYMKKFTY